MCDQYFRQLFESDFVLFRSWSSSLRPFRFRSLSISGSGDRRDSESSSQKSFRHHRRSVRTRFETKKKFFLFETEKKPFCLNLKKGFFWRDIGLSQLTSSYFILSHGAAGFYQPTVLKYPPSHLQDYSICNSTSLEFPTVSLSKLMLH